ncbi:MAG: general secretion pathway protein GspK [Burkholderiales bacterium]|nr:MAG: general secretion pathway protein GspK [Burkholderiales bacterium]
MRASVRPPGRQRGAAIITAMLVVTLAAVVVSGLFWREHVAVRSVENRLALAQARWIERAALDWAKVILRADARSTGAVDHLGEAWAVPVLDTRMDETVTAGAKLDEGSKRTAMLAGQIYDAQARFNITALVDGRGAPSAPNVKALRRLLSLLGKPESAADPIVARVVQSAESIAPDGKVTPASRPPLTRLADLLDVPNLDPSVVAVLEAHAIVLPSNATRININTAGPEVLAAGIEGLDVAGARRYVSTRERTPATDLAIAATRFGGNVTLDPALLSVGSTFFLVSGVIRYDRVESQTETLLQRKNNDVEVIWQLRL